MKILVTGGAGYIGSITTEKLTGQGHEVVVFDNLYQGHRAAVHPQAVFVQGDLAVKAQIKAAIAQHQPEAVMHFAAYSLVGESMQKPFKYLQENTNNGLNLMEAMCEYGVKKFILSSTANLFDQPERTPIAEDERIIPGSPYGESKFMMERALHWLEKTHGMKYACLRYFNAAGASEERGEDHNPELHLIPLVLQVALGLREHISIFGDDYDTPDGTCIRDYIHVCDLAQAHILALSALEQGSRTYNLGNGQGFSVKQVIETARKITGHAIPIKITPRRAGDPAVLVGASEKIRTELGWKPQFPALKDIIASAWKWHQVHPHGYADSKS
jgi:UDP-glucose 4-epimerase